MEENKGGNNHIQYEIAEIMMFLMWTNHIQYEIVRICIYT